MTPTIPSDVISTPFGTFRPSAGGGFEFYTPPALSRASLSSGGGANVVVNVAGSVVSENDLVEQMRIGLINAQKSGKQLVYSNT